MQLLLHASLLTGQWQFDSSDGAWLGSGELKLAAQS